MKGLPWQDETVQALKHGYQAEIDRLSASNASLQGMCDRLAQADAAKHREIIALRERVAAQSQALKVAEWGRMNPNGHWACPVCKEQENHGHADNCELAPALPGEA